MTKPTLEEIYLRLDWACYHIEALKDMEKQIKHTVPLDVPVDAEIQTNVTSEDKTEIIFPWIEVSVEPVYNPLWARELSYVVFNLRSALDYLVYVLALLDSGSEQSGTQFPIHRKKHSFNKSAKRELRGVRSAHQAEIESLQPYNGGEWLIELSNLSNPDKHKHLTGVISETCALAAASSEVDTDTDEWKVTLELAFMRVITFGNETPIIPLLECLHENVTNAIKLFEPSFEEKQQTNCLD